MDARLPILICMDNGWGPTRRDDRMRLLLQEERDGSIFSVSQILFMPMLLETNGIDTLTLHYEQMLALLRRPACLANFNDGEEE